MTHEQAEAAALINVMGMPESWLRKVYEAAKRSHVRIMCDSGQWKKLRQWMIEDEEAK